MELTSEEQYFKYWLDECVEYALISSYSFQSETFVLSDPVYIDTLKVLKTKSNLVTRTLLQGWTYTPDFYIKFNTEARISQFWQTLHCIVLPMPLIITKNDEAYIEIKPMGRLAHQAMSDHKFVNNQKATFKLHDIYVNKIIPFKLFEQTFVPQKVITDPNMIYKVNTKFGKVGDTKIKFKIRTIADYIKERRV